jgi:hypothetical protein
MNDLLLQTLARDLIYHWVKAVKCLLQDAP